MVEPVSMNRIKATIHPATGGISVDIPLMLEGKRRDVRLGITLLSAPAKAAQGVEDTLMHLEAAMQTVLTEEITLCDAKGEPVAKETLSVALAEIIEHKIKEPVHVD